MKKVIGFAIIIAMLGILFVGCKNAADGGGNTPVINTLEDSYFSVNRGTYNIGNIPEPSTNAPSIASGVSMNQKMLPGGSSYISINTTEDIQSFLVGVKGVSGFYEIPVTPARSAFNVYSIILNVSQNFSYDFSIVMSAKLRDNRISKKFEKEIEHLEAGTGQLQISLSFDQFKDVDLYVKEPTGTWVYFGNKGVNGKWGLDIDSMGLTNDPNNENVYYPSEYMLKGKYEVWINMYANKSPYTNITNYIVQTTYKGSLIMPTFGTNPTIGSFGANCADQGRLNMTNPVVGAGNGQGVKIMEFTINEGILER